MSIDFMAIDLDDSRDRLRALMGGAVESHVHAALDEVVASVESLRAEVVELRGERAAVVAWLRAGAHNHRGFGVRLIGDELEAYADHIERGEHRREEAK